MKKTYSKSIIIALFFFAFSYNSAFASVLAVQPLYDLAVYCDVVDSPTIYYPEINVENLAAGYPMGSIMLVVRASSTNFGAQLAIFKNNVFVGHAYTTVFSAPSYTTWDLSPFNITTTLGDQFRFVLYSSNTQPNSRYSIYGITATTSDHSITSAGSPACTSMGSAFYQIGTEGAVFQYEPYNENESDVACSTFDAGCYFSKALNYAFRVSPESFDRFTTLKDDLKDKAPFGYFTSAYNAISNFSSTSTPEFSLATSTPIMSTIFTPLRTGLSWLFIFAGLYWLYKRLTNIHI